MSSCASWIDSCEEGERLKTVGSRFSRFVGKAVFSPGALRIVLEHLPRTRAVELVVASERPSALSLLKTDESVDE